MPSQSLSSNSYRLSRLLDTMVRVRPSGVDRLEGPLMPTLIPGPTRIQAAGNKPKLIDELIGRVNSKTDEVSVAHMRSPGGWVEPGQTPNSRSTLMSSMDFYESRRKAERSTCAAGRRSSLGRGNGFAIRRRSRGRGVYRCLSASIQPRDGSPRRSLSESIFTERHHQLGATG